MWLCAAVVPPGVSAVHHLGDRMEPGPLLQPESFPSFHNSISRASAVQCVVLGVCIHAPSFTFHLSISWLNPFKCLFHVTVGGKGNLRIGNCFSEEPLDLSLLQRKLSYSAAQCCAGNSSVLRRVHFLQIKPIVKSSIVCNLDNYLCILNS